MADSPILPGQHAWKLTADGRLPIEFFQFLRDLIPFIQEASGNTLDVAELEARVSALEAASSEDALVQGILSVVSQGSLADGVVQLLLRGDVDEPGLTSYYGTNAVGEKGWYAVSDTLVQGDGIALTVNADGTTEIAHGDTSSVTNISANFSGSTVVEEISFTFDQFGHVVTRNISGRQLDHNQLNAIQGGSAGEYYHFTAAQHTGLLPWTTQAPSNYALITQTITNGDTAHAPSGDAVFDALAGKEPAIAAGTTGQFLRGDKAWSSTLTSSLSINGNASAPGLIPGLFGLYMAAADAAPCYSQADAFAQSAGFVFRRSNGTAAAPTALIANELIGQLQARGHDGTAWSANECAAVWLETDGAWSSSSHPAKVSLVTTASGSTSPSARLIVRGSGDVTPGTNNVQALGSASIRWSNLFATNIRPGAGSVIWTSGSGTPEGVVTAPVGSLYTRTDGGATTTLYVKESGAGNTGWVAK